MERLAEAAEPEETGPVSPVAQATPLRRRRGTKPAAPSPGEEDAVSASPRLS